MQQIRKSKKSNTGKSKRHIERLSHFVCGVCKKWWSIGDALAQKHTWYCPWCGTKQRYT